VSEQKIESLKELFADNLIKNIDKAAEASVKTEENVRVLQDKTNNIDKIIDQIVNVTLLTNMLAVSGFVEAARAGEYGRGFSVVAEDIRALANESSENADKIKEMVRQMQAQIVVVANDIEQAGKLAAQEVEKAKKSADNLNAIDTEIDVVQKGIQEINSGAQESLAALEQANKAVAEIAEAADVAAKAAEEAAGAAEQANKGLENISEAIEDIASQADEMQNMQ